MTCRAETHEQRLSYRLRAETHDPGTAAVPGAPLTRFLRAAPEGPAEVTLDEPSLTVRCGEARLTLKTAPASVFPAPPSAKAPDLTLPAGILTRLFGQTCFAASAESDRLVLCTVLVTLTGATLQVTASDGRRLAQAWRRDDTVPSNGEHVVPLELLVPRRSAVTLHGLLRDAPADAPTALALVAASRSGGSSRLLVTTPDWSWDSQLLQGTYPDVSRAIPTTDGERCEVERQALLSALSQTMILAHPNDGVDLRFSGTALAISGTTDGQRASVEIAATWPGVPRTVALNPRLLTQALDVLDDGPVQLAMHGELEPVVVTAETTPQWRYLLMPMTRPA